MIVQSFASQSGYFTLTICWVAELSRMASIDFIKVCRVSWPTDSSPRNGGAYAQL
jgi:hypothetical protein